MQKDFPNMQEDFANAKYNGDIKDWVADILLENLEITPSRESSLIEIDFTSTDPQLAANIANAFTDAYIQTNVELRAQPAKLKCRLVRLAIGFVARASGAFTVGAIELSTTAGRCC